MPEAVQRPQGLKRLVLVRQVLVRQVLVRQVLGQERLVLGQERLMVLRALVQLRAARALA